MNVEQRIAIERKVVRHLIRSMKKEGWTISRINDGGELDEDTIEPSETQAMDAVFAVDSATIYFRKDSVEHGCAAVLVVLGNDGWDCISDWTASSKNDFNALMDQISNYATSLEMA